MKKLQSIRGTKDVYGDDAKLQYYVIENARDCAEKYGYQGLSTPIFEFSEVFHRTLGDTSDIVSKETYTFLDRDKSSITLRPEFTAGIARAFISNGLTQSIPLKFFSSGPVFRHERPQKCRYRQFNQINCEFLGPKEPYSDVEMITLAQDILSRIGLKDDITLELNSLGDPESRSSYRDALVAYFEKYKNDLSEDSKTRLHKNPLRILDSKDEGDKKIVAGAPSMDEHFTPEAKKYFEDILEGLDLLDIKYKLNSKLVRGLDYYTHTVFEFTTDMLGSQGTVLAGGRYDGLIEIMGGPATPAIGFAAGVERLAELIKTKGFNPNKHHVFSLIPIGEEAEKHALKLAHDLRQQHYLIEMDYAGNVGKRMKRADKVGATAAIIFGEDEIRSSSYSVKNLESGTEEKVSSEKLVEYLRELSAPKST